MCSLRARRVESRRLACFIFGSATGCPSLESKIFMYILVHTRAGKHTCMYKYLPGPLCTADSACRHAGLLPATLATLGGQWSQLEQADAVSLFW